MAAHSVARTVEVNAMTDEPIKQSEIDFIRPRIEDGGWYYGDHHADEIANNAIDDLEVCLQRIDELETTISACLGDLHKKQEELGRLQKRDDIDYASKALDRY